MKNPPSDIVPFSAKRNLKGVLTGQRRGHLKVLKAIGRRLVNKHWATWYQCRCDCGNITYLCSGSLNCRTRSCGCRRFHNQCKGSRHPFWSGHGELPGRLWNQIRQGAAVRGLLFDLTIAYAWQLFLTQGRRCALSGVTLEMARNYKDHGTASLDRICSDRGYVAGNVQWVHKDVNMMKQSLPVDQFVAWCKLIASNAKKKTRCGVGSEAA